MWWVAINGAIALGAGEDVSDRLAALVVALPAWAYIGFRVRREIRAIREANRRAGAARRTCYPKCRMSEATSRPAVVRRIASNASGCSQDEVKVLDFRSLDQLPR